MKCINIELVDPVIDYSYPNNSHCVCWGHAGKVVCCQHEIRSAVEGLWGFIQSLHWPQRNSCELGTVSLFPAAHIVCTPYIAWSVFSDWTSWLGGVLVWDACIHSLVIEGLFRSVTLIVLVQVTGSYKLIHDSPSSCMTGYNTEWERFVVSWVKFLQLWILLGEVCCNFLY